MNKIQKHNLHNIRRSFEKKTGTRLLTASEVYAEETDRNTQPKSKRHPFKTVAPIILCVIILAGCLFAVLPTLGNTSEPNESTGPNPSLSESQVPSGNKNEEQPEGTKPTEGLNTDDYNMQIVRESDGKKITQTIVVDEKYTLQIDAVVDVSNVERVGMYEYIRHPITDSERDSLLAAYHGDRIDQVYHYTYGNANNWVLKNKKEFIRFGYSLSCNGIGEDTFWIRDQYVLIDEYDGYMLDSIDSAEMKISLEAALFMCDTLVQSLTDAPHIADNVRPFKQHQETEDGMLWIVYHRVADGMPITAYNDLKFYVLDSGVTHLHGALYDLEPVVTDSKIISLDDAIAYLQKNASHVNDGSNFMDFDRLYDDVIPISEITFEYVVVKHEKYEYAVVPVWRFVIGNDEESRLIARDRIISVNALTGELIADRRRATL